MRIYIARHGETQWNRQNLVCGRTDLPLTEEGRRQARLLAASLAGEPIRKIIASPLLRARETAAFAGEVLGLPVSLDPRLIERDFGDYEGTPSQQPEFQAYRDQAALRFPNGESLMDVAARAYSLLEELRRRPEEGDVLLVCHGGVCRAVRTLFVSMSNRELREYVTRNCQVDTYTL